MRLQRIYTRPKIATGTIAELREGHILATARMCRRGVLLSARQTRQCCQEKPMTSWQMGFIFELCLVHLDHSKQERTRVWVKLRRKITATTSVITQAEYTLSWMALVRIVFAHWWRVHPIMESPIQIRPRLATTFVLLR